MFLDCGRNPFICLQQTPLSSLGRVATKAPSATAGRPLRLQRNQGQWEREHRPGPQEDRRKPILLPLPHPHCPPSSSSSHSWAPPGLGLGGPGFSCWEWISLALSSSQQNHLGWIWNVWEKSGKSERRTAHRGKEAVSLQLIKMQTCETLCHREVPSGCGALTSVLWCCLLPSCLSQSPGPGRQMEALASPPGLAGRLHRDFRGWTCSIVFIYFWRDKTLNHISFWGCLAKAALICGPHRQAVPRHLYWR